MVPIQHQQLGHKQWYQVDLATGLQQCYPATSRPTGLWLWYLPPTGTGLQQQVQGHRRWYLGTVLGLLWQQQQGRRNGYQVVPELRQQWQQVKCRQQARPRRPSIQAKQQGCMLVRRGLQQWQQEQSHRLDMPRRPSTQAKWSRLSTSIGQQNYSVPRPRSIGQVPRVADHVWYQCHVAQAEYQHWPTKLFGTKAM